MRFLTTVGISVFTLLAACSASPADEGSASADVVAQDWRTSLGRTLSPQIAIPSVAEIGKSMDAAAAEETAGLTAGAETTTATTGCTSQYFSRSEPRRLVQRVKCDGTGGIGDKPVEILRIYDDGATLPNKIYADHNVDGRVDSYNDDAGPIAVAIDDNFDGRVDELIETAASLETPIDITLFESGWTLLEGSVFSKRIRRDTNNDGMFDDEGVTARDPATGRSSVFVR